MIPSITDILTVVAGYTIVMNKVEIRDTSSRNLSKTSYFFMVSKSCFRCLAKVPPGPAEIY